MKKTAHYKVMSKNVRRYTFSAVKLFLVAATMFPNMLNTCLDATFVAAMHTHFFVNFGKHAAFVHHQSSRYLASSTQSDNS